MSGIVLLMNSATHTVDQIKTLLSSALVDGVSLTSKPCEVGTRFYISGASEEAVRATRRAMLVALVDAGIAGNVLNKPRRARNDTRKQPVWCEGYYAAGSLPIGETFHAGFELRGVAA